MGKGFQTVAIEITSINMVSFLYAISYSQQQRIFYIMLQYFKAVARFCINNHERKATG